MTNIGTFNQVGDSYIGRIETLLFRSQATLEPVASKTREKSPDFRLFAGNREVGAAWKRTSREGAEFLSVLIEDPMFPAPVNARLIKTSIGGEYTLIWLRN